MINPDKLSHIYQNFGARSSIYLEEFLLLRAETRTDVLRITDKRQLDECLQKASSYETKSRYIIAFYRTAHSEPEWHVMDEETLPSFIRKQLP